MNSISAVIIDDQQECIDDLIYLVKKNNLSVNIIASANSGSDGIANILKYKPQLVFLDIMMPGMNGFEMLEHISEPQFQLIITTSVDKYAIQAIRSSALDFLLKPVKASELSEAVNRAIHEAEIPKKVQLNLLNQTLRDRNPIRKIALPVADGIELVWTDNILYFESDGNYTTVHTKEGKEILISKPIGRFEEMTDSSVFFRVHNSYLVNMNYINKFVRSDGGYIVLENGKSISVARNRKDAFLEALAKI